MKALVFNRKKSGWENFRGFDLVDITEPKLSEGEDRMVIVKVNFAGVCGTDRGIWYRQVFRDQILNSLDSENLDYRVLGHEFFGEVIEVGGLVSRVKKGDYVSAESHVVCRACFQCKNGQSNVCVNEKILGITYAGVFARYVKLPEGILWPTDVKKIRPEVAAVQEPFGNAVHAASKVNLKDKDVAIFGLGPIGQFLVLVVKAMGARSVIGVDVNPEALRVAKNLGVDYCVLLENLQEKVSVSSGKDYAYNARVVDEIMKITNGKGADVSFEMSGFNSSLNNCLFSTRRGGEVVLFGIKGGDFIFEDYNRLILSGFTIYCVIGREVFLTWELTKKLLEDQSNLIQEKIWKEILAKGEGTVLPIENYSKENFEQMMFEHPKLLIRF